MIAADAERVLSAYYDPRDASYPGHRHLWEAAPVDSVRQVLTDKGIRWDDREVEVFAAVLAHPSSVTTIELLENIAQAEATIAALVRAVRPAYRATLLMHTVTFLAGVALLVAALVAALSGRDVLTLAFGASGLGVVASTFLWEPLDAVQSTIARRLQLEIVYSGYAKQMTYWKAFARNADLDVKIAVAGLIEDTTAATLVSIEECCEPAVSTPRRVPSGASIRPRSIRPRRSGAGPSEPASRDASSTPDDADGAMHVDR